MWLGVSVSERHKKDFRPHQLSGLASYNSIIAQRRPTPVRVYLLFFCAKYSVRSMY